jgi:hypothetical protein
MEKHDLAEDGRILRETRLEADIIFVGGGIAGTCGAIAAAREGLRVVLVQDRPVLGGNASSEVRLWILGATSSMGNNNRWARECGVLNEILMDNLYRNPDGNALILDTILLEKVIEEPSITLLLNTSVFDVKKSAPDRIASVTAFCSQNSTRYILSAPFFCDASGDGIVGFLSGAAFRMGAEAADEFGEGFAPDDSYGTLLGHSIYFLTRDMGRPIPYVPPSYARKDVSGHIRHRAYRLGDHGCRLWWLEYGGRLDTIHQTEEIKWELWKVIYGIWDHVKNSGEYPEAENLTLEWVGHIPGKRESRRFEGDHILCQRDVVEQRLHRDAVSYGGWSLDLHPADGLFSRLPGCTQWHSKGIYQIPLRCLYSRNISNLWLAGRIISASHVAFGSTRVMATIAMAAQVIGPATRLCLSHGITPTALANGPILPTLQQYLLQSGHHIPELEPTHFDLAHHADITASSTHRFTGLPADGEFMPLDFDTAQLLPFEPGDDIGITFRISATMDTRLDVELRASERPGYFTPDVLLEHRSIRISAGEQDVFINFTTTTGIPQYLFICLSRNDQVAVRTSTHLHTGMMLLRNRFNRDVAVSGRQSPPPGIGIDAFDFWLPNRRPDPQNLGFQLKDPLNAFRTAHLTNGIFRPTTGTNAWVADPADKEPCLILKWPHKTSVSSIIFHFDGDTDHPLESTLRVHPERIVPHLVRSFRVEDETGRCLFEMENNHQSIQRIRFDQPEELRYMKCIFRHPDARVPAAVFGIQVS